MKFFSMVILAAIILLGERAYAQSENIYPTNPLPQRRQMHGSAVARDYLYVISGAVFQPTTSVMKASIGPDGQLSNWSETTPLPSPRLYIGNSTIVLGDIIYIVGGAQQVLDNAGYRTAIYSRPSDNLGNLTQWVESAPWPGPELQLPAVVATPGYLHLIGGLAGNVSTNQVYSIAVLENGHLGSQWEVGYPLPGNMWYHAAAVSSGRVYVWGGLTDRANTSVTQGIFSAPVLSSGKLGQWRIEDTVLPTPYYAASMAVAGPFLISFSPRLRGSVPTTDVWWTVAGLDSLSPWQSMQTAMRNRVYHAAAMDYRRGLVFLNGGRSSKEDVNSQVTDVVVFRLSKEARNAAYQGAQSLNSNIAADIDITSWKDAASQFAQAPAPQQASSAGGGGESALLQFKSFDQARYSGKPMAVLFHSNQAKSSQEQITALDKGDLSSLTGETDFVMVHVNKDPQMAQQRGVWKVPTWVFFDRQGTEVDRQIGLLEFAELKSKVSGLAK